MDLQLENANVLVTGGSRGIGRAIVEGFLAEGARVGFCARGREGVEQAARELGERAFGEAVDVTNEADVRDWVAASAERMVGLDVIVANVSALAGGEDPAIWKQAFETDLLSSIVLVQAALPYLRRSQRASIVFISSVSGREIDGFAEPYGAIKAALIHYGKGLSRRLAAEGIRVNTVSPGNVYFAGGIWERIEQQQPDAFAASLAANPLGRMATPREVANATVFLASPASGFTTGTDLLVDGSLTRGVQF